MTAKSLAMLACSLLVLGCGGGGGGSGGGGGGGGKKVSCADLFTTAVSYGGQEVVAGCYYPGTYDITASITQTAGTCDAVFQWQSVSGSPHQCAATLSGDATSGYLLDFGDCSLPGSIQVSADLSTFSGHFDWTVSCGSGTTTFQNVVRK